MAPITLYFFFSLILLIGTFSLIGCMIFMRVTGKSILGEKITSKHPAYKSVRSFSRKRNIMIAGAVGLALIFNLINAVKVVLNYDDPNYERFLFIGAPLITVAGFALAFIDVYRKFRKK